MPISILSSIKKNKLQKYIVSISSDIIPFIYSYNELQVFKKKRGSMNYIMNFFLKE